MDPTDTLDPELCTAIVAGSADAMIFADCEGIIRLWNDSAALLFGHSRDEAVGRSLDLVIPESLRGRHWEGYREVIRTGTSRYGRGLLSVPAVRRDGTRISLEFSIAIVRDAAGAVRGFAAVLRDVTERRRRDRELEQRLAALEAARGAGGSS